LIDEAAVWNDLAVAQYEAAANGDDVQLIAALDSIERAWPRAPVVVLASCSTGDESDGTTTISLSSAFVSAGASAVIASLWPVDDGNTARLMIDFHHHLSHGVTPAEALSRAQQSAIARNQNVASWAAFQVQM
jgi:CHAT domain-containing protein